MYLQNKNEEFIDAEALKNEILSDFEGQNKAAPLAMGDLNQEDIEEALGQQYHDAMEAEGVALSDSPEAFNAAFRASFSIRGAGKNIWKKLREILCRILNANSTAEEIIKAIIEALISLIPGGRIVKIIVEKIAKYFIDKGYNQLCPVPSPTI